MTAARFFKMKMTQPNDDEALRPTLREWKENSPLPPRFQEQVWQRIQKAEAVQKTSLSTHVVQWFERAFARPALAAAYVAILLFAGIATGYFQAQQTQSHLDRQLSAQYVHAVDPYQKVASNR